jgi:hypothetical protein
LPAKFNYLKKPSMGASVKPGQKLGHGLVKPKKPMAGIGTPKPGAANKPGAAPTGSPLPPVGTPNDALYNTDVAGINRGYADATTGLDAQKFQTRSTFGLDPEFANNPYTRANLLTSAYNRSFNQTGNSYAAKGQLYSGALDRGRAFDANSFQQGQHDLRNEYSQQLAGIEADRLSAERDKAGGLDKAYAEMLQRFYEKEPDASLYPEDEGTSGGGSNKKNPPKKTNKKNPPKHGLQPVKPKVDPGFAYKPPKKNGKK